MENRVVAGPVQVSPRTRGKLATGGNPKPPNITSCGATRHQLPPRHNGCLLDRIFSQLPVLQHPTGQPVARCDRGRSDPRSRLVCSAVVGRQLVHHRRCKQASNRARRQTLECRPSDARQPYGQACVQSCGQSVADLEARRRATQDSADQRITAITGRGRSSTPLHCASSNSR